MLDDQPDWPPALKGVARLVRDLAPSTVSIVERWVYQQSYVFDGGAWILDDAEHDGDEDEDGDVDLRQVDLRPRSYRGLRVSWGWCPVRDKISHEIGHLVDADGRPRSPRLRGDDFRLVQLGLAAHVLGPAAPADLAAVVSLCLALEHLAWVEDPTPPARG